MSGRRTHFIYPVPPIVDHPNWSDNRQWLRIRCTSRLENLQLEDQLQGPPGLTAFMGESAPSCRKSHEGDEQMKIPFRVSCSSPRLNILLKFFCLCIYSRDIGTYSSSFACASTLWRHNPVKSIVPSSAQPSRVLVQRVYIDRDSLHGGTSIHYSKVCSQVFIHS